jgi:hypothetical protein
MKDQDVCCKDQGLLKGSGNEEAKCRHQEFRPKQPFTVHSFCSANGSTQVDGAGRWLCIEEIHIA